MATTPGSSESSMSTTASSEPLALCTRTADPATRPRPAASSGCMYSGFVVRPPFCIRGRFRSQEFIIQAWRRWIILSPSVSEANSVKIRSADSRAGANVGGGG
jgi:hypothetical protein